MLTDQVVLEGIRICPRSIPCNGVLEFSSSRRLASH